MKVSRIIQEVKETILETNERIDSLGLEIVKFDVVIKTVFSEDQGVEGRVKIGPIMFGGKTSYKEELVNIISMTFEPEEVDVELQSNLSEILIEGIILMAEEICKARDNYPEFDFTSSSVEVLFDVTEAGKIVLLYQKTVSSSLHHSIKIYFEERKD